MLDSTTKKRIDDARDTLVGKLPDPKSQVEQITIALIYKFMDDMDRASVKLGGKAKFFSGAFKDYAWDKVFDTKLAGHEIVKAYGDAIQQLDKNPNVPQLFRNIFKNAYLPYRDPETLKSFLTIIDEFEYDHSEKLGDAFEYLLSVLGSQGEVGQFRTPRHIIDFIVEVINPQKNEKILDPACGTAGFLISAYKHILKRNSKNYSPERDSKSFATKAVNLNEVVIESKGFSGDKLTSDDRSRLVKNIFGYDISPDMIRLSLVNLYLHGFPDPKIVEYDTLTSEDRWNEYADVILANPPFMSPKGGIKPHKRFSVQSSRSEVLFVDYMLEHLSPTGRAGIIVPEGIIFNNQNSFVQIRKTLVDKFLVAVVSLPVGVFNPYSGVKTSILIIDKALARKATTVAFFKVENDGFDLGAQRRAIDNNDLPNVFDEITEYLRRLRDEQSASNFHAKLGVVVKKTTILASDDCSLTGDRYKVEVSHTGDYPWEKIDSLVETITPPVKIQKNAFAKRGRFPIIDQSQEEIAGWTDDETALIQPDKPLVIFGDHTCAVKLVTGPFAQGADGIKILHTVDTLDPLFLYHLLKTKPLSIAGYQRHFSKLKAREIPVPPLEIQKQVVTEIEGYQKVVDGARTVINNYRPHIQVNPDWPTVKLGDICSLNGVITSTVDVSRPYFGADSIESNTGYLLKTETAKDQRVNGPVYEFSGECLLYSKIRPYLNKLTIVNLQGYCSSDMYPLRPDATKVHIRYLATYMLSAAFNESIRGYYARASIPKINREQLFETRIPLPSLQIQTAIANDIQAEQAIIDSNRRLIGNFENRIQAALSHILGDTEQSKPRR
jgi:type I restriction enzyme M protein